MILENDELNVEQGNNQATIIANGAIINGDICSDNDIIIYGNINGNVEGKANVQIYGEVKGNIKCEKGSFDHAIVHGDIISSDSLEFTKTSVIIGDIRANDILNGGRIKGNLNVLGKTALKDTSAVVGDIKTGVIEIEKGAVLQGNLMIDKDVYFDGSED
ncbi:MAG: polymer-forming cytoskeletal protein [Erysipelotrichaceae bacterium]